MKNEIIEAYLVLIDQDQRLVLSETHTGRNGFWVSEGAKNLVLSDGLEGGRWACSPIPRWHEKG